MTPFTHDRHSVDENVPHAVRELVRALVGRAIDDRGRVWMVRQYRHSAGQILLELPAGTLEPGEDPRVCAARECREEIGMAPSQLTPLGEAFLAPGYSTEYMYFYLATGLTPAPLEADQDEELAVEPIAPGALAERIASGDLRDAKTLAALYLAKDRLGEAA